MDFCPYCNTPLASDAGPICPRCGERLPGAARQAASEEPEPSSRRGWSNRRLAAVLVLVMLVAAGGGLVLALKTQEVRRARDFAPAAGNIPAPAEVPRSPADWPELALLPAGCSIAAGIDVRQALQNPAASEVLAQSRAGGTPLSLGQVEQWTGMPIADFERLVGGLDVTGGEVGVTVVAVGRRPFDQGRIRTTVQEKAPVKLAVRFPDPRTAVIAFPATRPTRPPEAPASARWREYLRDHLRAGAWAWLAGSPEAVVKSGLLAPWQASYPEGGKALASIEAFALGGVPAQEVAAEGSFLCTDIKSARALLDLFRQVFQKSAWFRGMEGRTVTVRLSVPTAAFLRLLQPQERRGK